MNVIEIERVWKRYRLGVIGYGTLSQDLQSWWYKFRGLDDPNCSLEKVDQSQVEGGVFWALKDINLEIKKGEIVGIVGSNGAGKSTLLKVLSRVTAPTRGEIRVKGRIASLLEVGTGFHPELTGRENVYLNGAILGMTKKEINRKFDEIVDFSSVGKFVDTPVKRYSSGMRVRLGFAVAAHLDPEILVVDEVLAVGDADFQRKCLGKMKDIAGDGRTVLFVSHNMASIQSLCSRAVLLKGGVVEEVGEVYSIVNRYLSSGSVSFDVFHRLDDKVPAKKIWISSAYFRSDGKEANVTYCGALVEFVIEYIASAENYKFTFFIGIYNSIGEKVLHLGTDYDKKSRILLSESKGKVKCKIKQFPLVPGTYSVNLSLHLNGKPYDRVKRAFSFSVENGDFFGTGKLPSVSQNKFLVKQCWGSE